MGGRVPVFPTWSEERQLRLHQALHTVPRSPVGTRRGQCHTAGECGVPGDQAVRWRRGTAQAPHPGEQSGLWTSGAEVVQSPSRCLQDPGWPGAPVRTGVTKPGSVGRSTPGFAGFGLGGRQSQCTKAVHVGSDTRAQNWGVTGRISRAPRSCPVPLCAGCQAHDRLRIHQTLFSSVSFPVKIIPARPGQALNLPSLRISANDRETGRGEVYGTRRRALQTVRAVQPGERPLLSPLPRGLSRSALSFHVIALAGASRVMFN